MKHELVGRKMTNTIMGGKILTGSLKTKMWVVIQHVENEETGNRDSRCVSLVVAPTAEDAYGIWCDSVDMDQSKREQLKKQFHVLPAGFDELIEVKKNANAYVDGVLSRAGEVE
jgi:hypothetical protein